MVYCQTSKTISWGDYTRFLPVSNTTVGWSDQCPVNSLTVGASTPRGLCKHWHSGWFKTFTSQWITQFGPIIIKFSSHPRSLYCAKPEARTHKWFKAKFSSHLNCVWELMCKITEPNLVNNKKKNHPTVSKYGGNGQSSPGNFPTECVCVCVRARVCVPNGNHCQGATGDSNNTILHNIL